MYWQAKVPDEAVKAEQPSDHVRAATSTGRRKSLLEPSARCRQLVMRARCHDVSTTEFLLPFETYSPCKLWGNNCILQDTSGASFGLVPRTEAYVKNSSWTTHEAEFYVSARLGSLARNFRARGRTVMRNLHSPAQRFSGTRFSCFVRFFRHSFASCRYVYQLTRLNAVNCKAPACQCSLPSVVIYSPGCV
jgi:hypothetical protein